MALFRLDKSEVLQVLQVCYDNSEKLISDWKSNEEIVIKIFIDFGILLIRIIYEVN